MKLGFTAWVRGDDTLLDLRCVWNTYTISKSLYCINRNVHLDPVGAVS